MQWFLAVLILVGMGFLLRRILHMGAQEKKKSDSAGVLRGNTETICEALSQELETQAAILGVTLNDAFVEREANHHDMAWRIIRLALGEWDRLTELVVALHALLGRFLPATPGVVVAPRIGISHYKSRRVMDNAAFYDFLDQVLFSSRHRFAIQLRVLSKNNLILNREFHKACREGERSLDSSIELWSLLDLYFHDFDLVLKETLLAFHTLLACQTPEGAKALSQQAQMLLARGTRVSASANEP